MLNLGEVSTSLGSVALDLIGAVLLSLRCWAGGAAKRREGV
jgi:hypothetical protein